MTKARASGVVTIAKFDLPQTAMDRHGGRSAAFTDCLLRFCLGGQGAEIVAALAATTLGGAP